jgi:hypothetical protein
VKHAVHLCRRKQLALHKAHLLACAELERLTLIQLYRECRTSFAQLEPKKLLRARSLSSFVISALWMLPTRITSIRHIIHYVKPLAKWSMLGLTLWKMLRLKRLFSR